MIFETSFDDGHVLDLRIAELLKKYHLPGTFYITFDYVKTEDHLDWVQIRKLAGDGFDIGSHTVSHPNDLKPLSYEEKWFEIVTSKDLIEGATGTRVRSLCYPRGRFDDGVKTLARQAGYDSCRTTKVLRTSVEDQYEKPTTIHWYQRKEYGSVGIFDMAVRYFDRALADGSYFHLWGHSWEIERDHEWRRLEKFLRYAARKL